MAEQKYKRIGIIGGMGPSATASFYSRIISIFQKRFNAKYDYEFPEIIIISLPIPDIVENPQNDGLIINLLIEAARKLENLGCSFIAMPCNTIHFYINELRESVKIPVISIIEEVGELLKQKSLLNVGLLSTDLVRKKKLYELVLEDKKINFLKIDGDIQMKLTKVIMNILKGNLTQSDKDYLFFIIQNFKNQNAQAVVFGCTELPLLVEQADCSILLVDTLDVLAEACVRESIKSYINEDKK